MQVFRLSVGFTTHVLPDLGNAGGTIVSTGL